MQEKNVGIDLPKSHYYTERWFPNWRDRYTVNWMINRKCNFNCIYDIRPPESIINIDVDELVNRLREIQPLRLVITGGEPLLRPELIEICQRVGEFGILEIQSNFSVGVRKLLDSINPKSIERFFTTYHPQERKGEWTKKKFVEDVHYARNKGFKVDVFFVDFPDFADWFLDECKWLYEQGITPIRKRYNGDWKDIRYIGDAAVFKGKRCNAGHKMACMWEDFSLTWCDTGRSLLGNLMTEYKFLSFPVICPCEFCGCLGREALREEVWDEFYQCYFGSS